MTISITKNFWNSTTDQYNTIAKIVFTSPNIDSPAVAGTRSHILPGSDFIGSWFEAVDLMHRISWNEDPPDKQATYFAKLSMNQDEAFNFNSDMTVSVVSNYPVIFSGGQVVNYNKDEYGIVDTAVSGTITTFGGQLLGFIKENVKKGGAIHGDINVIYRTAPNSVDIYTYDVIKNVWDTYLEAPDNFGDYPSILKIGTKIYCIKGDSSNVFWEYDTVSFIWTNLFNLPVIADNYTFIGSFDDENKIYFLKAGNSILYEYNVLSNTWDGGISITLSGHDEVWYGPSFWKYNDKYYMWVAARDSSTVGLRCVEIDTSTGVATDKGLYKDISAADITNFISFGKDTTCSGLYGAGISTLSHYNLNGTDNEFLYSFHDVTQSGIDIIKEGDYSSADCFINPQDLFFPTQENINPEVASITTISGGNGYYFLDRENNFIDTYLCLYNLTASGTSTNCSTSYSLLSGESSDTAYTNLTELNDSIYLLEGVYSNSLWKYNIGTEVWSVDGCIAIDEFNTDQKYTVKEHTFLLSDDTDLYLLKGAGYNSFYKYTTESGVWSQLDSMAGILSEYAQGVYVSSNDSIYVIQGKDSSALWKYDVSGGSWSIMTGSPSSFTSNCGFHYPVWGGDYIYATRGRGYGHFWKYKISTNEWVPNTGLLLYDSLITGLTSRGTSDSNGKIYSIDTISVSEYRVATDLWLRIDGYISYNDLNKNFVSNDTGSDLYVAGGSGLRSYSVDNLAIISEQTNYDLTFSEVVGTSIVSVTSYFNTWENNLSNDDIWAGAKNTIIFEATNGEAYACKLTAWDDETHATTANQILNGDHYRVTCAAYKSIGGSKTEPLSGNHTDTIVHPVGVDTVLKGDDSYYGTFTFIHIPNGGPTGDEHGEYLIFLPRLAGIDDTFSAGNYDFVTTFHYSYT